MEKEKVEKVLIYSWEVSATGQWSPDTGIYLLRDLPVEELSEILWENGSDVENSAIIELVKHGNPRKAAEVARKLVEDHPIVRDSLLEAFDEEVTDILLNTPLEDIPSSPSEISQDVDVEYIQ